MKGLATFLSILCLLVLILGLSIFVKLENRDQQQIAELEEKVALLEQQLALQTRKMDAFLATQLPIAKKITYREHDFDTYRVDIHKSKMQFFHKDERGMPLRSLENLKSYAETDQLQLVFATNAGMYSPANNPVGLLVEDGIEHFPIDLNNGRGNFYLKPNGVFVVTDREALILESSKYSRLEQEVQMATQSGPLLLQNGKVHPAFREGSKNKFIRSGVGIINQSEIVFAISNAPINFYDFARFFKEEFGCQDALYLDGAISQMYLPALERFDLGGNFGPMIGILEQPLQ